MIPTFFPAHKVKFLPDNPKTHRVQQHELDFWATQPAKLIGNCFISPGILKRVFFVDDYSIRSRKGNQYHILYEDTGLDEVDDLDPQTVLAMVAEAELVENMRPIPRP